MRSLADIAAEVERDLPGRLGQHRIPGAAIGLVSLDEGCWLRTFGTLTRDAGAPVGEDTMFSVQSISKTYTAVVVLLAAQDGRVALDEPISSYFQAFTVHSRHHERPQDLITLRHLLSHTAGFTHEAPVGNNWEVGDASFEDHVASISDTWLRYPLGQRYEYSNLGIDLAAHIVSTRGGEDFAALVGRTLFAPLGLDRTSFDLDQILRDPDRATGHASGYDTLPVKVPMVAAGGLYTSVRDACEFVRFHLESGAGLVRPSLLAEMREPPVKVPGQQGGYGLGLAHIRRHTLDVYGHSGGGFGFLSDMYWLPSHGVGAVLLTNSSDHPLQGGFVLDLLDRWADNAAVTDAVEPASVAPSTLRKLEGLYVGRGAAVTLEAKDASLGVRLGDAFLPLQMTADNEAVIPLGPNPLRVRVVLDSTGRPSHAVQLSDGATWNFCPDPSEPGPNRTDWGLVAGNYEDRVFGTPFQSTSIRVEDGHLVFGPWVGRRSAGDARTRAGTPVQLHRRSAGPASRPSDLRQHQALPAFVAVSVRTSPAALLARAGSASDATGPLPSPAGVRAGARKERSSLVSVPSRSCAAISADSRSGPKFPGRYGYAKASRQRGMSRAMSRDHCRSTA